MTKYFKKSEFTYSLTAYKLKIDNKPPKDVDENLDVLMDFLDGVRAAWGSALIVNSGYRSPELNDAIGGAKNSGHKYGWAADLVPANNKKLEFFEFFKEYLKDKAFDELLLERNSKGSVWVHFSLYSWQGKQRRKIRTLEVK